MEQNWIKLTDQMPEPGKLVWVQRRWVPSNPEFGTEQRTEVRLARRMGEQPLVVVGAPWDNCYWANEACAAGLFSDVTVAGWQEIPPLANVVRACNSHEQLVDAALEAIRTELFLQDHPQKIAAQKALRNAVAAAKGA